MNNYSKIVELLNSSDPEVVILGLTYLDKSELGELLRKESNLIYNVPVTIYACQNSKEEIWNSTIDYFVIHIIDNYPKFKEFHQFKYKFLIPL